MNSLCKYTLILISLLFPTLAVATTPITMRIHVYSDGSIVVDLTYSERLEFASGELLALGELDINEDYYVLQLKLLATANTTCPPGGCFYVLFALNANSTTTGEIYEVRANLVLNMWDEKGNSVNTTVEHLEYTLNTTSLQSVVKGRVELAASGESAQILIYAGMLNKALIETALQQANITWISVVDFTTTVKSDRVIYEFTLVINELEMTKELELNITDIVEMYKSAPSTSTRIDFFYNTTSINASLLLRVSGDINEHLKREVKVLNETYTRMQTMLREVYTPAPIQPAPSTPPDIEEIYPPPVYPAPFIQPDIGPAIAILEKFTDNFTILKSRGTITVRLSENTLTVNITTPRLIKKNATSPLDTLIGLYNLAVDIQSTIGVEDILNTTVYLVPESGVKITRNGTAVEQVTLRELSEIDVETTSPTPTPPPSILQQIPPMYLAVAAGVVVVLAVIGILASRRK